MNLFSDPRSFIYDPKEFSKENKDPQTKYGLPQEVQFCSRCVISNQRPNSAVETKHTSNSKKVTIKLNKDGICDACLHAEKKAEIMNWDQREKELIELCDRHRSKDGSYDCIVPGSGGKDSFYQAHILKYKYGMNPLTITWAPHIYTEWGWRNFQKWIHAGFDNLLTTPNGRIHRLLTRLAVENLFHPFQPFILGQKGLAPKLAALHDIKLVFYGENEAEYGNPVSDNETAKRDHKYFSAQDEKDIFIGGTSVYDLKSHFGLSDHDLIPYKPIDPQVLEDKEIEVHYLGYYLKWHPQGAYYYAVENGGFEASPERTPGTYSKYNSIDDKIDDFHYYTTYVKFGIGRTTYDAAQEVRSGDITRDEGVALVKRYDGEFPERFAEEIFSYLSIPEKEFPIASKMFETSAIDRAYFDALTDKFRSPHLWYKESDSWHLRKSVFEN